MLLWSLGMSIAFGSRWVPSVRAQITRTLTVEFSAGDDVARYWRFDGPTRTAISHAGRAAEPDLAVHFATSRQALTTLVSTRTSDKLVNGLHRGTVQLRGSAFVLLWFYGLTRKFAKFGRASGPRHRVPGAYLAHDPAACGSETIVIEPAVTRLDPDWTAAWAARSTLSQVRSWTDEPMLEP